MTEYRFTAVDAAGRTIDESIHASNQSRAIDAIRDRGLTLLHLDQAAEAGRFAFMRLKPAGSGALRRSDLGFIFRHLATLLRAGLELDRALDLVATMTNHIRVKQELLDLRRALVEGRSLSDYMTGRGALYPAFAIGVVRAGEASGALHPAFEHLAAILERDTAMRKRIVSATIYPSVLIFGSLASIGVLLGVVLPRFEPIFAQADQELPWATRMLLQLSSVVSIGGPFALLAGLLAFLVMRQRLKNPQARTAWDRALLSAPLLGTSLLKSQIARLSTMMGGLLEAGLPLLGALTVSEASLSNTALRGGLRQAIERVRDGEALSEALSDQPQFPELLRQMIRVGEETASLSRSFKEVGLIFDQEFDERIQRMLALITPITTIVLGAVIAGIIAAILSAVLGINDLAL